MTTETREVTLSVPDVSCEHCVHTINGALGTVDGVRQVSTDVDSKTVHVAFDPGLVTLERIETLLDDEGYPVKK